MSIPRLTLYVLARAFEDDGHIRDPNPMDRPHIERCVRAALLESTTERVGQRGYAWTLTPKGRAKLQARHDELAANPNTTGGKIHARFVRALEVTDVGGEPCPACKDGSCMLCDDDGRIGR